MTVPAFLFEFSTVQKLVATLQVYVISLKKLDIDQRGYLNAFSVMPQCCKHMNMLCAICNVLWLMNYANWGCQEYCKCTVQIGVYKFTS